MKKNFNVNMILSIIFISLIYSLAIGVKPAKADCDDVTKDPCFSGMFDVPTGKDTVEFYAWAAGYINQSVGQFEYLKTLDLMIDTCNIIGEKIFMLTCTSPYKGIDAWGECVYIKYVEKQATIPFGFTRVVNIGDTLEIIDFDGRNTEFLYEISSLNTKFCDSKIILKYYDSLKPRIILELKLENHVKTGDLHQFFWEMNVGSFSIPTMFSIAVSSVINHNGGDSFLIMQQNDELHISTDFTFENTEIEIYDLLGICQIRSDMNSSEKVLDISRLPRGVYFVRIGSFISKFIRE